MKYGKQGADAGSAAEPQKEPSGRAEGVDDGDMQADAQAEIPPELRRAEFEKLIKGEYKDQFAERTQQIINERFKEAKGLKAQVAALTPILEMLAERYGVPAEDVGKLAAAIEEDAGFYEQEAIKKGMTVEQYKEFRSMERENAAFKKTAEERERQENINRIYARWNQEAEDTKQVYAGFDLSSECNHPQTGKDFLSLLRSGIPVRTAYEVVHKDEILGGAMRYTAEQVQKKTMDDIRARGMRPQENGTGGQGAADVKADVSKLTRADREEIAKRVAQGERISFGA